MGIAEMKKIQLTQGKVALVDDMDYAWLNRRKWYAKQYRCIYYAQRSIGGRRNRKLELMHRVILELHAGDKRQCDHRDGDGLNNRRTNLRICTGMQNIQSSRKRTTGTSKYKGVHWFRRDGKWYSKIQIRGKQRHLGGFESEIDAAKAYDKAALICFGDFALTNERLRLYPKISNRGGVGVGIT